MAPGPRIAVTGLGGVCALGASIETAWAAAVDGQCGIVTTRLGGGDFGPPEQDVPLARVVEGYGDRVDQALGRAASGGLDPFARMSLAAAYEALDQAGLVGEPVLNERCAIVLGHGQCGLATLEASYQRFFGLRSAKLHPATVPKSMMSAAVSAVAMTFGVHGPVFSVSSACASSAHAIVQGASLIASGEADVAIVGGSDAVGTAGSLRSWEAIGALAAVNCRPFSTDRDGMVVGEGGAVLILESDAHALARGARVLAHLTGVGMSSDAYHLIQPSSEGPLRAIRKACAMADLGDRDDILVSAHGTGTQLNDINEAHALHEAFGARAARLPVIATKASHGHLIGGTAALQAALGLRSLAEGLAPPIANLVTPDPACGLDLVHGAARPIAARVLLQNAFAFGGLNVALVFEAA